MRELGVYGKRLRLVRGKGPYVWDDRGRKYIDAIAGVGLAVLGHAHEVVARAVSEQMSLLPVAGNMFLHRPLDELLEELGRWVKYEFAFFSNSGSEAVENAIKLARLHTGRSEVVAMVNGFHGRTLGALAATWREKYREGFGPLPGGFRHIPFNDIEAAQGAITNETAAVLVEPIQGEGGVVPAKREFLKALRELCSERGALLIADEVQTGLRTGSFLACQGYGVEPDIVAMGKGLANGLPIGLTLSNFDVPRGKLGSTFGGNPVACAAAAACLRVLRREQLVQRAAGKFFEVRADKALMTRGRGLMMGVVLREPAEPYMLKLQEGGILVNTAGERVLRLLPPLIVEQELQQVRAALEGVLNEGGR